MEQLLVAYNQKLLYLVTALKNRTAPDSHKLQGVDLNHILSQTAPDSEKLGGMTLAQILSTVDGNIDESFLATKAEMELLTQTLTGSFQDGLWGLGGGHVLNFEEVSSNPITTGANVTAIGSDAGSRWWVGIIDSGAPAFYRTVDNGINWYALSAPGDYIRSIAYGDGVLGVASGTQVFKSTDYGSSFQSVETFPSNVKKIVTDKNGVWTVVTSNAIYVNTDNLDTGFTQINPAITSAVADVAIHSTGSIYLLTTTKLFMTPDQGDDWMEVTLPISGGYTRLNVAPSNTVMVVNDDGELARFKTTNGSWEVKAHTKPTKLLQVDHHGMWVQVTPTNEIYRSIDDGRNWSKLHHFEVSSNINSIYYSANGWMLGGDDALLKKSID
jgi:hypothetical protein